jgi:hypothetical protein
MADLYSFTQTYTNAGAAGVTMGANARKTVVYYPNAAETAANPYSQLGTRELVTLKATASTGTPFAAADLADANSAFHEAISGLQTVGEIYMVQRISDTVIGFIMSVDTHNKWDDNDNSNADYSVMETALANAVTGAATFTVAASALA